MNVIGKVEIDGVSDVVCDVCTDGKNDQSIVAHVRLKTW